MIDSLSEKLHDGQTLLVLPLGSDHLDSNWHANATNDSVSKLLSNHIVPIIIVVFWLVFASFDFSDGDIS